MDELELRIMTRAGGMELRGVGRILTSFDDLEPLAVGTKIYDNAGDLLYKRRDGVWAEPDGSELAIELPVVVVEVPE